MSAAIYNPPDVLAISPQERTTADHTSDTGVDISAYEGVLSFVLDATNRAGTTPTLAVKLQHNDVSTGGDSGWADVPSGAFTGLTDAAHSPQTIHLQKNALKKYVRSYRDIGGTSSPAYDTSVLMVAYKKRKP